MDERPPDHKHRLLFRFDGTPVAAPSARSGKDVPMRFNPRFLAALTALGLALNGACVLPVLAQSGGGSAMAPFQAGYGAARYTTARPNNGSTRDANGNRLIVNGIIQAGASSYSSGAASATTGAGARANAGQSGQGSTAIGGATAIGNSLNVVVQGSRNTVVVNSNQTNTGNVSAGTVLNGTLVFP